MSRLTDEELLAIYNSNQSTSNDLPMLRAVADAAVAADKSEPVAEVSQETYSSDGTSDIMTRSLPIGTKLYTHPQYPAEHQSCANREKCQALANAVLNDMDCHPAFVKAMAADGGPVKEKSTRLTTAELIDRAKCTLKESNELISASKTVVPEDFRLKALELCAAVENKDDLPAIKYGLRCGRLVNEVKAMLATQKEPTT